MTSFFGSKVARELATIIRRQKNMQEPEAKHLTVEAAMNGLREDPEYFADRHSKQMQLARAAQSEAARAAHLEMATIYREKAADALRLALRNDRDRRQLALMELPADRNPELETLLDTGFESTKQRPPRRSRR